MSLPSLKMSRRGFARAAAFAALVLAAGAKAITPGAADDLKTVRIFYPPLDFGWTSGYELIEVANAQGLLQEARARRPARGGPLGPIYRGA